MYKEPRTGLCNICNKSVSIIEVHQRKVHGHVSTLEVIPCVHCYDWFINYQSLNEHIAYHDIERDLRSKCAKKCGPTLYIVVGANTQKLSSTAQCEKPFEKWHLEFASPSADY